RVLVPPLSGVFSALGLLLAAPRADAARTVMLDDRSGDLAGAAASVISEAESRFEDMFGHPSSRVANTAEMRYRGQSHELEVPGDGGWDGLAARFHTAHLERFGFDRAGEAIEVVNLRATAYGEPPLDWGDLPSLDKELEPVGGDGIWQRQSLPAGFTLGGPAVVVEDDSATLLEEDDIMTVLPDGALEIAI
ncbi:MAG: hypothetical protein WCE80_08005, partial [Acidimicrobiia bacterium]